MSWGGLVIKLKKPTPIFKKGDRVLYTPPRNPHLSFWGVVEDLYGEDRLLVSTQAGHTWALKIDDITLREEN